jgi:hypothetical protein
MAYPTGQYYIDAIDLYNTYGVTIKAGSNDLLRFPKRKDSISHNWPDQNGIDIDLKRVFFEPREVVLECVMYTNGEQDFTNKYMAFLSHLARPGTRRIEISEVGKSFHVYYKDCTNFVRHTRIKTVTKVVCEFSLVLVEVSPEIDASNVYLITDDNLFLIS